jgi:hypothetical protein
MLLLTCHAELSTSVRWGCVNHGPSEPLADHQEAPSFGWLVPPTGNSFSKHWVRRALKPIGHSGHVLVSSLHNHFHLLVERPRPTGGRVMMWFTGHLTPGRFNRRPKAHSCHLFSSGRVIRFGWSELDLEPYRKGDPEKLRIASRLRNETTMTLTWIAERLLMGTKTHLSHLLYWRGEGSQTSRPAKTESTCGKRLAIWRDESKLKRSITQPVLSGRREGSFGFSATF